MATATATATVDPVTLAYRAEQDWLERCLQDPSAENIVDWHTALHAYAQAITDAHGWQETYPAMSGLLKARTVDLLRLVHTAQAWRKR
jgi:hypothetical protein